VHQRFSKLRRPTFVIGTFPIRHDVRLESVCAVKPASFPASRQSRRFEKPWLIGARPHARLSSFFSTHRHDPTGKPPFLCEAEASPAKPPSQKYFFFQNTTKSPLYVSPSHPVRGACHDRRIRGVGMRWTQSSAEDEGAVERTAKSSGSDASTLASSRR
jgi:hypothetical protein